MKLRAVSIASVAAIALAAAACSNPSPSSSTTTTGSAASASPVSSTAYASQVCTALDGWIGQVRSLSKTAGASLGPTSSPDEKKAALTSFLNGMGDATDQMISDVESAGAPAVAGGQDAAAKIGDALSKVKDALDQARQAVANLPTDDATAFTRAAQQLGSTIQASLNGISSSISGFSLPALDDAFRTEPACQQLARTTGSSASPSA